MSYNLGAFYALKPVPPSEEREELYWNTPNLSPALQLGQPLFQDVIDGKKTAKAALQEWQTAGRCPHAGNQTESGRLR